MLAPAVAAPPAAPLDFRDVRDPKAFVHATINRFCRATAKRGPIILTVAEHEELHAEGMAIMCKLADEYKPHIAGYQQEGRFSGYAAMYLPRKLGDAWHRMHEEHMLITQPDGSRRWRYGDKHVSLDAIVADDPDRSELLAQRRDAADLGGRLHRALYERWCREVQVIVEVGELLSEGATDADVASMLAISPEEVRAAKDQIARVMSRMSGEDE